MNSKKDFSVEPQKQDFSDMILSETLSMRIDTDAEVFESYSNVMWKGFFEIRNKLINIPKIDIKQAVISGINLIDNLFWFIYNYSFNLQLTLFLTERGKLLFTEFLVMSRTHQLMKQIEKYPTVQDAFHFSIKRSIGSLSCTGKAKKNANYITNINSKRAFYKNVLKHLEHKIDDYTVSETITDYCTNSLQRKILQNIDHNIDIYNKLVNLDTVKQFTLNGFIFFMNMISNNILQPHDDLIEKIGVFIGNTNETLNRIYLSELDNKAHHLLIQWETEVVYS